MLASAVEDPNGLLTRMEVMLSAAVESRRREARLHRAVASLEAILRSASERRSALAFRAWSARVSEAEVNADLIKERGILIESFTRGRLRMDSALREAQAEAAQRKRSAQLASEQLRRALRAASLAFAASACLSHRSQHALAATLSRWRASVALLGRAREEERARLWAHEGALAELRLKALCVLTCAPGLRSAELHGRLGEWRSNARAMAASAVLRAERARALSRCLANHAAAGGHADEARLLRSLARWGRFLRARLSDALAGARREGEQHLRVALGATARRRRAEQPQPQSQPSPAPSEVGAASPQGQPAPALERGRPQEPLRLSPSATGSAARAGGSFAATTQPSALPSPSLSVPPRPELPEHVRAQLAVLATSGRPALPQRRQPPGLLVRRFLSERVAPAVCSAEPSVAELQQLLVRMVRERDALEQLVAGGSPLSSCSPAPGTVTPIGGSEALGAALRAPARSSQLARNFST